MPLPEDLTKDWPAELKSDPSLKDVNDVQTLAKNLVATKALVGSSLRPPGPDASAEARLEFVTKLREKVPELVLIADGEDEVAKTGRAAALERLGKPKEAKGYTVPKDVEDLSAEELDVLRAEAFEEGLTNAGFQVRVKRVADGFASVSQSERDAVAALKKELGGAFEERTGSTAAIAAKLGFPEAVVSALKAGSVDLPTYRAFAAVAKGFGETRQVAGQDGGGGGGKLTPDEARAQRAEIMARPEYFSPKPAQMDLHRSLVAKVQQLNEQIGGAS